MMINRTLMYNQLVGISLLLIHSVAAGSEEQPQYVNDPFQVVVQFSVKLLGFLPVSGLFQDVSSTIIETSPHDSHSFDIVVGADSIDTRDSVRDDFIRSSAFFDVEQFPTIRFSSARLVNDKHGRRLTGELTLHGVTRPVSFELIHPESNQGDEQDKQKYTARTTIKRTEFGLNSIRMAVSNHVEITVFINEVADWVRI